MKGKTNLMFFTVFQLVSGVVMYSMIYGVSVLKADLQNFVWNLPSNMKVCVYLCCEMSSGGDEKDCCSMSLQSVIFRMLFSKWVLLRSNLVSHMTSPALHEKSSWDVWWHVESVFFIWSVVSGFSRFSENNAFHYKQCLPREERGDRLLHISFILLGFVPVFH